MLLYILIPYKNPDQPLEPLIDDAYRLHPWLMHPETQEFEATELLKHLTVNNTES